MSIIARLFKKESVPSASPARTKGALTPGIDVLLNEGKDHFQAGRLDEARRCYRRILELQPSHARALYMLGGLAINESDTATAIDFVRRALKADPGNADYCFSLASVYLTLERPADAIPYLQDAVRLKPDAPDWRRHLAAALQSVGRLSEAAALAGTAAASTPTSAQAQVDLGNALQQQGKLKEAELAFAEAVRLAPEAGGAHVNLAMIRRDQGRPVDAESAARRAVELAPDMAQAWFVLGSVLFRQAHYAEAEECLEKAIALQPDHEPAWDVLLFAMTYSDRWRARDIYEAHRRWGQRFPKPAARPIPASHRQPGHRVRIAYLSGDFRQHPIANFMEAPLKHHDRGRFEVFCYHNDGRIDATTGRLRKLADHWRALAMGSDEVLERTIVDDGIDILVELSGHTDHHALRVLARRPAPIQVSYLGYPNTTGLDAIDYRITDALADPPGQADDLHVEKLLRIPDGFLCYSPTETEVEVAPAPVKHNGFVTFGSFNNYAKISPATIALWVEVLERVPDSKLLIKAHGLQDPGLRALLLDRIVGSGVAADRIDVIAPTADYKAHMESYGRIDIALDAFPYHGTTTSFDALWMGVPVVTLEGDRHASRVGVSILSTLDLTDLIAHSAEEYVAIAERLAKEWPRLDELRGSLRERLAGSALADGAGFTRRLEQAYLQIWSEAVAKSA